MSKADLRRRLQEIRDSIPTRIKERLDHAVTEHLLAWDCYRSSTFIFCFVSFRSEVNTFPIIEASLHTGKTVSVPRINLTTGEMRAFVIEDTRSSLEPGAYGILQPVEGCPELDDRNLELIIAPGLAFTRRGERLGYGGGFYDRFMERHRHATVCALTYNCLMLDELPVKDHDLPVDHVITETGVFSVLRESP